MPKKKTTPAAPATAASVASTHPPIGAADLPPAAHTVLAILDPDNPTTAAEAAERTGLGRSTVTKALAVLHGLSLAVRQEGGHEGTRRIADRWFAAPWTTEAATNDGSPTGQDSEPPIAASTEHGVATAAGIEDPAAGQQAPDDAPDAESPQQQAAVFETAAPAEVEPAADSLLPDPATQTDQDTTGDDTESMALDRVGDSSGDNGEVQKACEPRSGEPDEGGTAGSGKESHGSDGTISKTEAEPKDDTHSTSDPAQTEDSQRLGKGELRAMVEDHLRQHPEQAWTSTQIHHVLQRSSGAIANACETLVKEKTVIVANDKPRKFQWNSEDNSTE